MMLDKFVDMTLSVPSDIANKILKDGFMEIALRDGIRRFESFTKVSFADSSESAEESCKAVSNMIKMLRDNFIPSTSKELKTINAHISELSNSLKNTSLSIDTLMKSVSNFSAIGYLNAGIGVANLAVSIAGFVIINDKLKALSAKLDQQSEDIAAMKNIMEGNILQEYRELAEKFGDYTALIRSHGMEVSRDDTMEWLRKAQSFISKLVYYIGSEAMETKLLLNMVFTLLPAYTALLIEFSREFYFDTGMQYANMNARTALYTELLQESFIKKVQNHLFLSDKLSFRSVTNSIRVQNALVINNLAQVEDEQSLLSMVKTKEEYSELKKGINRVLKQAIVDSSEEMSTTFDISQEECVMLAEQFSAAG